MELGEGVTDEDAVGEEAVKVPKKEEEWMNEGEIVSDGWMMGE